MNGKLDINLRQEDPWPFFRNGSVKRDQLKAVTDLFPSWLELYDHNELCYKKPRLCHLCESGNPLFQWLIVQCRNQYVRYSIKSVESGFMANKSPDAYNLP